MPPSIYQYIKDGEKRFQTENIPIGDNWFWNFRNHVQMIFHLTHNVFFTGENNWLRVFKQVMLPLIRLSMWIEDLEKKDVVFFTEDEDSRIVSFILKKFHEEVYAVKHDLDKLFDDISESDITYGGILVQRTGDFAEAVYLNSVAMCNQSDVLKGPIAFKFTFSPDGLREMSKKGWGNKKNGATISIEDLIVLATQENSTDGSNNPKLIEVYITRGNFPESYLKDDGNAEKYYNQLHVIAFYVDKESKKTGVTLYRNKEDESNLKFHTTDPIYNRGLGFGDGEAILPQQIWTNFLSIHKMNLLESGSKVPLYTDDPSYAEKNKIQDMENLELTKIGENKRIYQVPTASPMNIQLFENSINELYQSAQLNCAANDPLLGKEPVSGTTFRGQERSVYQGKGWHDRRKLKRAKFIEELYRDWFIDDIVKEVSKIEKFSALLSNDEMMWVSEQVSINMANKKIKKLVLDGKKITKEEQKAMIEFFRNDFMKNGNKKLIYLVKDWLADKAVKVRVNVAGKSKDLAGLSDKFLSIFQNIFANPAGFQQAMQIPSLANAFANILEFSGMSIVDFKSLLQQQTAIDQAPELPASPAPEMLNSNIKVPANAMM